MSYYTAELHKTDDSITNIIDTTDGHTIAYIQRYENSEISTEIIVCPRYWEELGILRAVEFLKIIKEIGVT